MKKILRILITSFLTGFLAACNLPGATTVAPTPTNKPTTAPSTVTVSPPTATSTPVTATVPPLTATSTTPTPAASQPVTLERLYMLNDKDGWGWATINGEMNRLLLTADGGQTWKNVSPHGDYTYLESFFLNSKYAWLPFFTPTTNSAGMLRTTDGGQNWAPLPSNDILQNATLTFTSPNNGLARTAGVGAGNVYFNYYETVDGGITWKPVLLKSPKPESSLPPGTIHLCNICGDQLYYDSQRTMISYGELANEPSGKVNIAISYDLGKTWKNTALPIPGAQYAGGMVAPLPVIFFDQEALLPVNILKYNQDNSLSFSILVIYTSLDGGKTWKAAPGILQNKNSQIDTVQVLSPKVAFARCDSNLCSTSDGAQTWKKLPDSLNFDQSAGGSDYVSQVSFVDPSTGWALTGESGATTLWKSTDGGASWNKLSPSLSR